jgi:CRP/FNR family transcriptional regulator, cyclic AMP receptor protein
MATGRLFELDPDLLQCVPADERATAQRAGQVVVERVATGPWSPPAPDAVHWGTLIVEGMAAREVTVAGTRAAELLGSGDVIVGRSPQADELIPSDSAWTVLESLRVVVLDEHLLPIARRWPSVTAGLVSRVDRRADRLAVAQAISHLTRVDTRVLTMMWLLADRWGRVSASGVILPLRLTHRTMAHLVGARRPTVTTAISDLTKRGLLSRREDGSWTLHGPPPEELERAGVSDRISATPAPPPRPALSVAQPADLPSLRRIADQVRRLAASYEEQQARATKAAEASRSTRARSRQLRDQVHAERTRLAALNPPRSAPPSA